MLKKLKVKNYNDTRELFIKSLTQFSSDYMDKREQPTNQKRKNLTRLFR